MTNDAIEKRLDSLTDEISLLKAKLEDLALRFSALEVPPGKASGAKAPPSAAPDASIPLPIPELDSESIWSWVGQSAFLPRVATVCFILVFALILRTLTDNGFVGKQIGSYLGMLYAAALVAWGWRLLIRKSRLATVFAVCGTLLMYSIAIETHARFGSVSAVTVYFILLVMLGVITLMSLRFGLAGLNSLGIFGTCLVAAAIDFPRPNFGPLVFLLFGGNIMAYVSARRLPGCEWNRWAMFILTACVWLLWAFKLRVPLAKGVAAADFMAQGLYLPALLVFAMLFMGVTMAHALKNRELRLFDLALPTMNGLWAYPFALMIIQAGSGHASWLGVFGVLLAALHFGFAAMLFKGRETGGAAICGFTFAGGAYLVLAFPAATGSLLIALPVWSVVAYGLARMSEACEIGGVRLTSYILQFLACLAGVMAGSFAVTTSAPYPALLTAGVLTCVAGLQYKWCRENPLACRVGFFARVDRDDRSAVVLLASSLVSGFYLLQLASYLFIGGLVTETANVLMGTQSVLINVGAIGLMLHAMSRRNKEILWVAVLVVIIGALKVFGHDLFKSHGIPLVLSVFSFGAVAAIGSVVMSRWSNANRPVES